MRTMRSPYMEWAKRNSQARFNLATSGVGSFPLSELPLRLNDLDINGPNAYGYRPLIEAIARKEGVDPGCVVTTEGASMANYLAMAALIEPGDEVLIERPAYELLVSAATNLGAVVRRFDRTFEAGYAIEVDAIRRAMTPQTRLIVITNLHNPSSAYTPPGVLRVIGDLARAGGARVLVDEVYLDALYEQAPPSSFHLGTEFVVTNSLTKMYGVSGLRCGWILAEPDLAQRLWGLNDLMSSVSPYPAQRISHLAMEHLPVLRDRARRVLDADRRVLIPFLGRAEALACGPAEFGTTCFPRLRRGDVGHLIERLRAKETSVVPGHFFESGEHFRIGMGVDHDMFCEGLRRLEEELSPVL